MSEIAILIPTYKPGKYIERCLSSIEAQTLSKDKFRLYLALNGPSSPYDKYLQSLLCRFTFNYEYLVLEEPGVSGARNALIDSSTEPFITFVDDDDVLSDNFLENLLDVSDEKYIGISNAYSFKGSLSDKYSNFIGNAFLKINEIETSVVKARKYFSSPWAKLIHRTMIGSVRFDKRLAKGEDALFMARVSPNVLGVRKAANDTCYYVYERRGSASRRKRRISSEISRVAYLTARYCEMLVSGGHDKLFILTRIAATLLNLKDIRAGD